MTPTVQAARNREKAKATPAHKRKAPAPAGPKVATTFDKIGLTPEWDQFRELKELKFGSLCETLVRLEDEIKFREAMVKELKQDLEAALMVAGTERVTWEDRPVSVVHSRSGSRIIAEKLLMNGVPADVIADSTEAGKEYSYVKVGKVGEGVGK